MGSLYKRGNTYWMKYYVNGQMVRKSTGCQKKMQAKEVLKKTEARIAEGKVPGLQYERVRFNQLADMYIDDYTINERKSLKRADLCVRNLSVFFDNMPATKITSATIAQYIKKRLDDGVKNATINRELSALKRMMNLGYHHTPQLVERVPKIVQLKERNTRSGFFEHEEFLALRDALPDYLYGVVTFAYKYGWRIGEIRNLKWKEVDRKLGVIRIDDSKNEDGRVIVVDKEMRDILNQQWRKIVDNGNVVSYVFTNDSVTGPVGDFKKSWASAVKSVCTERKLFHDFRRTAVRNMVRAGVPEVVAMKISGHKTRAVFDRYNIVNEQDLMMAADMTAEYTAGTNLGTAQNNQGFRTSGKVIRKP